MKEKYIPYLAADKEIVNFPGFELFSVKQTDKPY